MPTSAEEESGEPGGVESFGAIGPAFGQSTDDDDDVNIRYSLLLVFVGEV